MLDPVNKVDVHVQKCCFSLKTDFLTACFELVHYFDGESSYLFSTILTISFAFFHGECKNIFLMSYVAFKNPAEVDKELVMVVFLIFGEAEVFPSMDWCLILGSF